MQWRLIVLQIVSIARKIPYTISLSVLVIIFLVINALRLVYGVKCLFLLFSQFLIFSMMLFEPRFLITMDMPEHFNNIKKFVIWICTLLIVALLYFMVSFILSLVNVYSITAFLIITFILWKPLASLVLCKAGVSVSKKQLFNLILATIVVTLIMIGGSYAIFRISIMELYSLDGVSEYVFTRTYYSQLSSFRSYYDIYYWILFGVGACDEMALVVKNILEEKGYEVYITGFPGEDHYFAIVYVNGSWIAIDPGYFPHKAIPLDERVRYRVKEYGNVSSIIAYVIEQDTFKLTCRCEGFVELTQYYLPYDTFVIHVTYRGHPIIGAQVVLKHRFHGSMMEIPGKGLCFYTNESGYVTIHLGGSMYNKSDANPYDPCFEIYVNGKPTGIYIQSTMSGKTHYIEIDLYGLG